MIGMLLMFDEQIRWQLCEAGRRALERLGCRKLGRCLECGREISSRRLEAVPWTDCCLDCQARREETLAKAA